MGVGLPERSRRQRTDHSIVHGPLLRNARARNVASTRQQDSPRKGVIRKCDCRTCRRSTCLTGRPQPRTLRRRLLESIQGAVEVLRESAPVMGVLGWIVVIVVAAVILFWIGIIH